MDPELIGHGDLFTGRHIGSVSELKAANHLRNYGWKIFSPGGSRGPVDFLAIRNGSILGAMQNSPADAGWSCDQGVVGTGDANRGNTCFHPPGL